MLDPKNRFLIENEPVCEFNGALLPPGLLIRWLPEDYGWKDIADQFIGTADSVAAVVGAESGLKVDMRQRRTSIVEQVKCEGAVREMVRRAYRDELEPFFGRRLRWFEAPSVLRYTRGDYYRPHADSDRWDKQAMAWKRVYDRHLSLLIYTDDDYNGGQLVFPNFDFRVRPRAGMLVAFPSDHRYLHGAMPVLSGLRHAVVSWSAVEGERLLNPEMPSNAIVR